MPAAMAAIWGAGFRLDSSPKMAASCLFWLDGGGSNGGIVAVHREEDVPRLARARPGSNVPGISKLASELFLLRGIVPRASEDAEREDRLGAVPRKVVAREEEVRRVERRVVFEMKRSRTGRGPKLMTVEFRMWHLLCVRTVMPPPSPSSTVQFFMTVRPLPLRTRHGERLSGYLRAASLDACSLTGRTRPGPRCMPCRSRDTSQACL